MQQPAPPFSLTFSPQLPELMFKLGITLAVSTYQAGKVIMISPRDQEYLVQLPRTFSKAMGIAVHPNGRKLAVATKDEVIVFANSPQLAAHYPTKPNTYDALFMPRATYHTGALDIHDLDWGSTEGGDTLYAVNTAFSCIIKIDDNYSFTPVWKPPFISKLASEDRCHLNGMAMQNGKPKYVSAFNTGDTHQSWRKEVTTGGILMDVVQNELVAQNLPMPHSPRLIDGNLLVLFSATGELVRINIENGSYDVITQLDGFVRGMDVYGDYAFIGLSRLRKNSSTFAKLKIADRANQAGISVVHLPTGARLGEINYLSSVDEIYDVQVLPNMTRPNILNTLKPDYKLGLDTPEATFWAIPQS
ncbi:MAG: TIGR03032 family protein [Bacteroidia bacterium]